MAWARASLIVAPSPDSRTYMYVSLPGLGNSLIHDGSRLAWQQSVSVSKNRNRIFLLAFTVVLFLFLGCLFFN